MKLHWTIWQPNEPAWDTTGRFRIHCGWKWSLTDIGVWPHFRIDGIKSIDKAKAMAQARANVIRDRREVGQ